MDQISFYVDFWKMGFCNSRKISYVLHEASCLSYFLDKRIRVFFEEPEDHERAELQSFTNQGQFEYFRKRVPEDLFLLHGKPTDVWVPRQYSHLIHGADYKARSSFETRLSNLENQRYVRHSLRVFRFVLFVPVHLQWFAFLVWFMSSYFCVVCDCD